MIVAGKKGVTLTSLVIYVVLFTVFTVFATNISSNLNENILTDRGEAINYATLNKLEYNICASSNESDNVTVNSSSIGYSNGDVYTYDNLKKVIYKNGGVLCQNVDMCNIALENQDTLKKVTIQVSLNKYLSVLNKEIICTVEGAFV